MTTAPMRAATGVADQVPESSAPRFLRGDDRASAAAVCPCCRGQRGDPGEGCGHLPALHQLAVAHRAVAGEPQHFLYLRAEPHQQGWLRPGGQLIVRPLSRACPE